MNEKMEELINKLNEASYAYYNGQKEIMSNYEWDAMFDELAALEKETGIILPNSPTQIVGASSIGKREKHEYPALSLAKTKSIDELVKWANGKFIWMSWKLDGLTLVATYDNGKLSKLMTRGDGTYGTNITHLAGSINGIPEEISYKGHMVARGEAVISYDDFERINEAITDEDDRYANPRNLASGTLNLDDINEVKARNIQFIAFTLVYIDTEVLHSPNGIPAKKRMSSWGERMGLLTNLGFEVVEHAACTSREDIERNLELFTQSVPEYPYPVDGLVVCYEDNDYAQTGSVTGHHATRAGFAFKWQDETVETKVLDIEWSASRTGLINPVALLKPVELEGTTVSRATLHNVSYILDKDICVGDIVKCYKANKIIPKIHGSVTSENEREGYWNEMDFADILAEHNIPNICPVCGRDAKIHQSEKSKTLTLHCENEDCGAKKIGQLERFVCKDALNIEGLSSAKLMDLLQGGFISNRLDLINMADAESITNDKGENLVNRAGWGKQSVENLVKAINKSCKEVSFERFIYSMGIPNVGSGQAKVIYGYFLHNEENKGKDYVINLFDELSTGESFEFIDGIGEVIQNSLMNWFEINVYDDYAGGCDSEVSLILDKLLFREPEEKTNDSQVFKGMNFVITGSVTHYANRDKLKAEIESYGGKVTGSVTSKTNFLINNDVTSTSGKNKKAKELNIPIISEEEFMKLAGLKV